MKKVRLDKQIVAMGLVDTRSQAENYIKLGFVTVNGQKILKPGYFLDGHDQIKLNRKEKYVSRAGLKLEAANKLFKLDFKGKVVLDAGSSTGGFTDYCLQHGAKKAIAVEVGKQQMHPKLLGNPKIELHEQTDIRDFLPKTTPDVILADLSFISLRQVLPHLASISGSKTRLIVLMKPQFEARRQQINRGVVKNSRFRRQIVRHFEIWVQKLFKIVKKVDSDVAGEKGNIERFYLLKKLKRLS